MKKTVLLGVSMLLGGCVSMDRIDLSRLKPMHSADHSPVNPLVAPELPGPGALPPAQSRWTWPG
jgi:hypothetical protein